MRAPVFIVAAATALVLAASTQANNSNARLCAKDWDTLQQITTFGPLSWPTLQNGTGGSFSSLARCARSHDVWAPSISLQDDGTTLLATGFHPNERAAVDLGFVGSSEIPYFYLDTTDSEGALVIPPPAGYVACPGTVHYALVFDADGVHAGTSFSYCSLP
jgi:hypothetical protein